MFFRTKQSGSRIYLQIVENNWKDGKTKQSVIATIGRLDRLQEAGKLEGLLQSGARFCKESFDVQSPASNTIFSSHQVSKLLQVSPSTVVGWINQGKLSAFRTPGGHRRIKSNDIRRFLETSQIPIPPELGGFDTKKRVFVVDDDPIVVRTIKRGFTQYEETYEIDGCQDGIEALVLIGAQLPDLVLLDIYMEGIDGFEVCRRLRKISHLSEVQIIAMTAHPSEEARARILDYGATDYWVKPVKPEQIIALLES